MTTFDTVCLAIGISNKWTRNQKSTFRIYTSVYETHITILNLNIRNYLHLKQLCLFQITHNPRYITPGAIRWYILIFDFQESCCLSLRRDFGRIIVLRCDPMGLLGPAWCKLFSVTLLHLLHSTCFGCNIHPSSGASYNAHAVWYR